MSDDRPDPSSASDPADVPVAELAALRVAPHPDLKGRVQRDINRRNLVADSLDFSLNVMLQTFWEYLHGAIEAWPGKTDSESENRK